MRGPVLGERVALVGQSGSGKTTAAQLMSAKLPRLIVLDPKDELDHKAWRVKPWGGWAERALRGGRPVRACYSSRDLDSYDRICELAYDGRDCAVYIDEVYGIYPGGNPGPGLTALFTRGRSRRVSGWGATQRPSRIPLYLLSEANWYFIFRLRLAADRKRVEELIGPNDVNGLRDYQCVVYNIAWDAPRTYSRLTAG